MGKLTKIPIDEAKGLKVTINRKSKVLEKYKNYLIGLSSSEAGKLQIKDDKEGFTVRAGLKRAAEAMNMNVKIKKRGDSIVFWKE